jgi:CHAD domain-containing protein
MIDAEKIQLTQAPVDPVARRILGDLEKRVRNVAKAARRIGKKGDDEAIHDTRVATRRLSSALYLWRSSFPRGTRRRGMKALRKLRKVLGKPRELEVHLELLKQYLQDPAYAELRALQKLVRKLERSAKRARIKSASAVTSSRSRSIFSAVYNCPLDFSMNSENSVDPTRSAVEFVNQRRELAVMALEEAAKSGSSDEQLHEARIAGKKWRYGLECLQPVIPERYLTPTAPLKEIQEQLGKIHDLSTLHALLVREMDRLRAKDRGKRALSLKPLLQSLHEEKLREVENYQQTLKKHLSLLSPVQAARLPWSSLPSPSGSELPPASPEDRPFAVLPTTRAGRSDASSQES